MALEVRPLDARLQIQFDLGEDENGRKITRTRTFSRIRSDITDQDLFDVASALAALQSHPVIAIRKVAQAEYVNV